MSATMSATLSATLSLLPCQPPCHVSHYNVVSALCEVSETEWKSETITDLWTDGRIKVGAKNAHYPLGQLHGSHSLNLGVYILISFIRSSLCYHWYIYNDTVVYPRQSNFFRFSLRPAPVSRQSPRITFVIACNLTIWKGNTTNRTVVLWAPFSPCCYIALKHSLRTDGGGC